MRTEVDQDNVEPYKENAHGLLPRRGFFNRVARVAGGAAVATALVALTEPPGARAATASTDTVTATGGTTARSLGDRFGEVYNVLDYGATRDGVTNDAAAFQAAIDRADAAGGGLVSVPAGTYAIATELTHNSTSPITLKGDGRDGSILKAKAAMKSILTLQRSSRHFIAQDILFDCQARTTFGVELDAGATDAHFHRCKFRGTARSGYLFKSLGNFLEIINCHFTVGAVRAISGDLGAILLDGNNQGSKIRGCRISGVGRGLRIIGTRADVEGLRLTDTHFVNTGAWNAKIDRVFDLVIDNCAFDQATAQGVAFGFQADRVTISNSWFGAPARNTTSLLIDIGLTTGSQFKIVNNTFLYGASGIKVRASATNGEYLRELIVDGNMFNGHDDVSIALDSVMQCTITNNTDNGKPRNGSWTTAHSGYAQRAPKAGEYTFNGNHWHTAAPGRFSTLADYRFGDDTGIVGKHRTSTAVGGAATSKTVDHGCFRTPGVITFAFEGARDPGMVRITDKGAKTVTFTWPNRVDGTLHHEVSV